MFSCCSLMVRISSQHGCFTDSAGHATYCEPLRKPHIADSMSSCSRHGCGTKLGPRPSSPVRNAIAVMYAWVGKVHVEKDSQIAAVPAPQKGVCVCVCLSVSVCVCGTPVCQGFNDSFVYLYAGGAGSSDTARANEALCQMDRETYLQVSSWVLEAQLDWP